jgi:hypothetical protein
MLHAGISSGEFDSGDGYGFQFLTHDDGITLQTGSNTAVPSSWILLDNQSTVDVFTNRALLTNICEADGFMDIHCNAGVSSTHMVGDLPGYGTVWFNPNGIANILSL